MRKTLTALALAASFVLAPIATPVVGADHGPKFCRNGKGHPVHGRRWCIEKGYGLPGRVVYRPHGSAWQIVRRDPCLSDHYRRFAARHQNPNKRARFIDRLAREGCPDPENYYWSRRDRYRYDDYDYRYDRGRYYYPDRTSYEWHRTPFDLLFDRD